MAHQLTINAAGQAAFAFTGGRDSIWHRLGQAMDPTATIEQWRQSAGMDFEILESAVAFQSGADSLMYPNRKVLFRNDNNYPLGLVSDDFKVVQPEEVMEFFRDLTQLHGMKLSTAGTLFGGKRFWALAEMGVQEDVTPGDTLVRYLLLATGADGSLATTAKVVAERVLCHNTMSVALSEATRRAVRVTHKSVFDPDQVKLDMGLIDKSWDQMMKNLRKLAATPMDPTETLQFYQEMYFDKKFPADEQPYGVIRKVKELTDMALVGAGASYHAGTAWGALCGATELFTHGSGRKVDAQRHFWDTNFGTLDSQKHFVYNQLVLA